MKLSVQVGPVAVVVTGTGLLLSSAAAWYLFRRWSSSCHILPHQIKPIDIDKPGRQVDSIRALLEKEKESGPVVPAKTRLRVVIAGAGLCGALLGVYLANAGFSVIMLEQRGNVASPEAHTAWMHSNSRAVGMTLSPRGIRALRQAGISREEIMGTCVDLEGRAVHQVHGQEARIRWGGSAKEKLKAVDRAALCHLLCRKAIAAGAEIVFEAKCVAINVQESEITYTLHGQEGVFSARGDLIVGADGIHSPVREALNSLISSHSESIPLAWTHLTLSPQGFAARRLHPNFIHVWPRGNILLHCLPSISGRGVCTLIMPKASEGLEWSFGMLASRTKAQCEQICRDLWPDLLEAEPSLVTQLQEARVSQFRQVVCSRFHFSNRAVLIGDAAHATFPFFGQGMNIALEDAQMLAYILQYEGVPLSRKLHIFSEVRVPDGCAVQALSREQYEYLTQTTPSPLQRWRQALQRRLNTLFPSLFYPLKYALVNFCDLSYNDVIEIVHDHSRFLNIGRL